MALINRISRLFQADFHAVLDQVEEPELLLRQAVREMEDELAAAEQHIRLVAHEQKTVIQRLEALGQEIAEIDRELDLCFASGKDDLARGLIKKKIEGQRLLKRLSSKSQATEEDLNSQRASVEDNRTTLEGLRQKAELFAKRSPVANTPDSVEVDWLDRQVSVTEDEVEIAYLREKNRRVS